MKKIRIVTRARLNRALQTTSAEFDSFGIWNKRLAGIPVNLIRFSRYYGWQAYGSTGEINIPAFSLCRLKEWYLGSYVSLADVLRHEYAHAIARCYPLLIRSRAFTRAFAMPHDSEASVGFIDGFHLTEYAATSPAEDFAETFMFFMRSKGRLKRQYQLPLIRKKWQFIHKLCRAIQSGKRSLA